MGLDSRWAKAPPLAHSHAARPDLGGHEFAVHFFSRGKDAVADFEVFQRDRLALFVEGILVIDHDDSLTLAAAHLDLVLVNGKNFAARPVASAWTSLAATGSPIATSRASSSTPWTGRATARSAALESLELFLSHASNTNSHNLFVGIGCATHKHVIANLEVLQLKFLLFLAVARLVVNQDGRGNAIRLLDLKAIDAYGGYGSHYRRATHAPAWRFLPRSWGLILCCQSAETCEDDKKQETQKDLIAHRALRLPLTFVRRPGLLCNRLRLEYVHTRCKLKEV